MGKAVQTDVSKTFENLEKFKVIILFQIFQPEDWPNRLSVTFDFPNKALDWFVGLFESGKPNYNIMDTDYDNYVIGKPFLRFKVEVKGKLRINIWSKTRVSF